MASAPASSNKAKIARRVIEVLDYFDDLHREATVMDIVRRYGRPQSSTSELLTSLVELGLLHKDPHSRTYALAPRAALLGTGGQSAAVRDGSLVHLLDRLTAQTGLPVALFAMTGLNAQIVAWRSGSGAAALAAKGIAGGMQVPLSASAAGWLLLSTVAETRSHAIIRRLNAEASEHAKFSAADMAQRLLACRETGHVRGPGGYNAGTQLVARLLPVDRTGQPIAVGFVHGADDQVNSGSLLACLDEAIRQCLGGQLTGAASVERLASAA